MDLDAPVHNGNSLVLVVLLLHDVLQVSEIRRNNSIPVDFRHLTDSVVQRVFVYLVQPVLDVQLFCVRAVRLLRVGVVHVHEVLLQDNLVEPRFELDVRLAHVEQDFRRKRTVRVVDAIQNRNRPHVLDKMNLMHLRLDLLRLEHQLARRAPPANAAYVEIVLSTEIRGTVVIFNVSVLLDQVEYHLHRLLVVV